MEDEDDVEKLREWIIVVNSNGNIESASSGLADFLNEDKARAFAEICDERFKQVAPHRVIKVREVTPGADLPENPVSSNSSRSNEVTPVKTL